MKYTGRFVIIIFGTVVHMGIFTYLLFWRPHPDHIFVFFLISGLWGVSDAVWQTQINGNLIVFFFTPFFMSAQMLFMGFLKLLTEWMRKIIDLSLFRAQKSDKNNFLCSFIFADV